MGKYISWEQLIMKKQIIFIFLIFLILISSLIQYGDVVPYNLFVFEISVVVSIILSAFIISIPKKLSFILVSFMPVLFFSAINSIIENSFLNFISILFYFISIFLCLIIGSNINSSSIEKILKLYFYMNMVIHILGIVLPGIESISGGFPGIFGNPNAYGLFSSFSFSFLYLYLSTCDRKFTVKHYIFFILNAIAIMVSVSRSAVISLSLSLVVYYFLLNFQILKLKVNKKSIKFLISAFILVFLLYFINFFDRFLQKNSSLESDLSSGRIELWIKAYNSLRFYGYGSAYYKEGDLGTHNNYLNLGVVFGGSVMASIIIFWIIILIYLVYIYTKTNQREVLLSIGILIFGLSYWMFEIGSNFIFVWIFFIMFGYTCFNTKTLRSKYENYSSRNIG